jgi:hypothetical protein
MNSTSRTGVTLADDFRDNLIIDRFDPMFRDMRRSKLTHMRSENSEDAVTWNVFRTLRQVDPRIWFERLFKCAFPTASPETYGALAVYVWRTIAPPRALTVDLEEGDSEIDVVLETPHCVWFIEAKYRSDISTRTTSRPDRDQVIRNIDVGSYYAGVRRFYFSLLMDDTADRSPLGSAAVSKYKDLDVVREILSAHRPDGLRNLAGISSLSWNQLGDALRHAATSATREDERGYAARAHAWLRGKGLCRVTGRGDR